MQQSAQRSKKQQKRNTGNNYDFLRKTDISIGEHKSRIQTKETKKSMLVLNNDEYGFDKLTCCYKGKYYMAFERILSVLKDD